MFRPKGESGAGCYTKQPKSALNFYFEARHLSTSGLALGESFPVVPALAAVPAVTPLPVAPPAAMVTTPGFVVMVDPEGAFCNAPSMGKWIRKLKR